MPTRSGPHQYFPRISSRETKHSANSSVGRTSLLAAGWVWYLAAIDAPSRGGKMWRSSRRQPGPTLVFFCGDGNDSNQKPCRFTWAAYPVSESRATRAECRSKGFSTFVDFCDVSSEPSHDLSCLPELRCVRWCGLPPVTMREIFGDARANPFPFPFPTSPVCGDWLGKKPRDGGTSAPTGFWRTDDVPFLAWFTSYRNTVPSTSRDDDGDET